VHGDTVHCSTSSKKGIRSAEYGLEEIGNCVNLPRVISQIIFEKPGLSYIKMRPKGYVAKYASLEGYPE